MNEEEIATLNEAYAKIADILDQIKEAQRILTKDFEFEQDYYNPLHCYADEKLLIELRDKLIKFVIGTITKGVNYEINEREIFEWLNNLGRLSFNAQEIVDYINENYEAKADELSLKAIKAKMGSLIPRMNGPNWETRKPEMDELLKKDTLILKCWLSWEYRFNYQEFMERMTAFGKYVAIELVGAKPSEVKTIAFREAYSYDDGGLGVRDIAGSFYQSVQLHKNSTLRVRFKPGYAEKIAKAILRDFYNGSD